MATPDVRVRLSAEGVQEVIAALRKIQAEGAKASASSAASAKGSATSFTNLNSVLGSTRSLLASLGVALSIGAFVGFVKNAAAGAEQIGNLGQRTGKTGTEMLALGLRAQATSTDIELVAKSSTFLTRRIEALSQGSGEARAVFERLGLTVQDFKGKNAAQQYELVVRKLAELEDGGTKAVLTTDALGKSADKLIPLFNDLAAGGLERTVQKMRQLGIDESVLNRVKELDDASDDLAESVTLVGLAFVSAMSGGTADTVRSFTEMVDGQAGAWRAVGQAVGFILSLLIPVISLIDQTATVFSILGLRIAEVVQIARGLGPDLRTNLEEIQRIAKETDKKISDLLDEQLRREFERRRRLAGQAEARPPRPRGAAPDEEDSQRKRQAVRQAEVSVERKHWELLAKIQIETERRSFEAGEISLRQFFARRRQIMETAQKIELTLLEREFKDLTPGSPEAITKGAEIERKKVEGRSEIDALAAEELQAAQRLGKEREQDEIRLLELQGRRHEAALIQIEEEIRAFERRRIAAGLDPAAAKASADELRRLLVLQEEFRNLEEQSRFAQADFDSKRIEIQTQVSEGLITESEGEERILALKNERLKVMVKIAEAQLAVARATGDEEKIRSAKALLDELRSIAGGASAADLALVNLGDRLLEMAKNGVVDALANSLNNLFDPATESAESFRESLSRLVDQMRQVIVQTVLMKLAADLIPGLAGGGKVQKKAAGGLVVGRARGLTVVRRASGGVITGPGTGTSDSIPALLPHGAYIVRAAAVRKPGVLSHLLSLVTGRPRAPRREDLVAARVSNREFYVPPEVAQEPGMLGHLEAINRGRLDSRALEILRQEPNIVARASSMRLLSHEEIVRPRGYAQGGLVGEGGLAAEGSLVSAGQAQPGVQQVDVGGTIKVELAEGLRGEATDDPRKLLQIVDRNPKAFRRALGLQ